MAEAVSRNCANCKKTEAEVPNMKRCAKCHTTPYCSRECQKADWKNHKKQCSVQGAARANSASSTSNSGRSAPKIKNLEGSIDKPFHKLDDGTYLHDLPEKDVYKLLVDAFRLRLEDKYKFEGEQDGIYAGESSSIAPFKKFLRLAESRPGLLPPWWNDEKKTACVEYGETDSWGNLGCGVEKSDIIEHYGSPNMPMQLRMLAEEVYGTPLMGADGKAMRMMMMAQESGGGGLKFSHLDLNV